MCPYHDYGADCVSVTRVGLAFPEFFIRLIDSLLDDDVGIVRLLVDCEFSFVVLAALTRSLGSFGAIRRRRTSGGGNRQPRICRVLFGCIEDAKSSLSHGRLVS